MSASSFIARRYFKGKKGAFVSFLGLVAVCGIFLGVLSLVVVISVMLGFNRDLERRLMGFSAHVMVDFLGSGPFVATADKPLASSALAWGDLTPGGIESSAEIIEGEGIIEVAGTRGAVSQGVKIRGMDERDYSTLRGVDWYFPDDSRTQTLKHSNTVVLGSELAFQLGVHPDYNDRITIIVPIGDVGPTGELVPKKMTFDVRGMFRSGYFEHDSKTVVISKEAAERLLGSNASRMLHIWLNDASDSKKLADRIRAQSPELRVMTWEEANKKLFAALKLERATMGGLLVLIIIIACISIISAVFLYVFAKRKDIAVLASIGYGRGDIRYIFIKIGAYMGAVGTLAGLACGAAVCIYLMHADVRLPASYYLDHLPVVISWPFLLLAVICGVGLAVLASLYPASQAARLDPLEALRYE